MKLVTAIMPTRGKARNVWAAMALDSFLSQAYPAKQLIILDDREDPSFNEPVLVHPGVFYFRIDGHKSIPEKRNICCVLAAGEIVMHFDSDDHSAPDRMAAQVHLLNESGKQVTGFHSMYFHAENGQWWRYRGADTYALGTSLCYTRAWQETHPFDETLPTGEDSAFVKAANRAHELITLDAGSMMFARAHPGNTSDKKLGAMVSQEYRRIPVESVPEAFLR